MLRGRICIPTSCDTHIALNVSVKFVKFKSEHMCVCVRIVTEKILSQMGPLLLAFLFLPWPSIPFHPRASLLLRLHNHIQTHHTWWDSFGLVISLYMTKGFTITLGRTPLFEWSALHRDLYLTAHNTHKRLIDAPRWNLNHNPSKQSVDPHGHWDRLSKYSVIFFCWGGKYLFLNTVKTETDISIVTL
jgi:hypothetical protein